MPVPSHNQLPESLFSDEARKWVDGKRELLNMLETKIINLLHPLTQSVTLSEPRPSLEPRPQWISPLIQCRYKYAVSTLLPYTNAKQFLENSMRSYAVSES